MPDISMCKGGSCLLRLNCHRYTATAEPLGQSFMTDPPYKMEFMLDKSFNNFGVVTLSCPLFWNNQDFKNEKPGNKSGLGEGIS